MKGTRSSRHKNKRRKKYILLIPLLVILIVSTILLLNNKNHTPTVNKENNTSSTEKEDTTHIENKEDTSSNENLEEEETVDSNEEESTVNNKTEDEVIDTSDSTVNVSDTVINFWFGRNSSFARPVSPLTEEMTKKYNSYYMGENKKVIYLTFDEGISTSYASKNLDTLKKYNIKATFFLTKGFIEANPALVNRMVNEGHICGNHTWNHKNMATLAKNNKDEFVNELASTEEAFEKVTNKKMDKVLRFPEGNYSERALLYANELGYRSIFWSFAYKDWNANWNSKAEALKWMKTYYHPGAIYLLHGINKANSLALDDFISYMLSIGYTFDVPTNIP